MRKIISVVAVSMLAGLGFAQAPVLVQEKPSDVSVSADAGLYSAYVWRGQVINNQMVAQPSVTAAKGPFSLNVWGNWNASDNADQDTAEVDYTAAYTLPLPTEAVKVDVGLIAYTYPGHGNDASPTEEIFVKSTFNNIILTPVASLYYDADQADGWYGNLALSQGVEISDALKAEIGGSVGYGTRNYNSYNFGGEYCAFNDFNVYVSTKYALTEKASIGALLQYTYLNNDLAVGRGQDDDILWGGINLSYKFL